MLPGRYKTLIYATVLLLALIISWFVRTKESSRESNERRVSKSVTQEMPQELSLKFDSLEKEQWMKMTPLEFLKRLTQLEVSLFTINVTESEELEILKRWENSKDELFLAMNDDTPCPHIVSVACSFLPMKMSTVGHEATYLLYALKVRKFPPTLGSHNLDLDKEEIRDWYMKQSMEAN